MRACRRVEICFSRLIRQIIRLFKYDQRWRRGDAGPASSKSSVVIRNSSCLRRTTVLPTLHLSPSLQRSHLKPLSSSHSSSSQVFSLFPPSRQFHSITPLNPADLPSTPFIPSSTSTSMPSTSIRANSTSPPTTESTATTFTASPSPSPSPSPSLEWPVLVRSSAREARRGASAAARRKRRVELVRRLRARDLASMRQLALQGSKRQLIPPLCWIQRATTTASRPVCVPTLRKERAEAASFARRVSN